MLSGETQILTVYLGPQKISESIIDTLVYSWSPITKLPAVGMINSIVKDYKPTIEVLFDSGLSVKCTPDHEFYLFRGEKILAQDLEINQSVRAFSGSIHRDGHLRIHGFVDNKARHQYVARLVWEYYNGPIEKDLILHHKNFLELDNRLENFELLTRAEHNRVHYPHRKSRGFYKRNHKVVGILPGESCDVYKIIIDGSPTCILSDPTPIAGIFSGIVST